jgi:magnesium chelatase family protein
MILAKEKSGIRVAPVATLREALHALLVRAETGTLPAGEFLPHAFKGGQASSGSKTFFGSQDSTGGQASGGGSPGGMGDFSEVRGQERYKRALEIAAAGGHNLLVFGPPGAGKTMLARRMPSIMAPLSAAEAVEVTRLCSLAGLFDGPGGEFDLITRPPFRSPHHSASAEGILGGGRAVRPGEISLAHLGVLFLDEAPEFRSPILQALREPLEDQVITISRAEASVRLPAAFQLILAANPCPCGRLGMRGTDGEGEALSCFCSPEEINRYWRRFGSALLDRIELRVPVLPPRLGEMTGPAGESSAAIARRVARAVEVQRLRLEKLFPRGNKPPEESQGSGRTRPPAPGWPRRNARIPADLIERCCPLSEGGEQALKSAAARLALSGRAYHGILRVARTIADLEGRDSLEREHVLEAVEHRRRGDDPYDILAEG